MSDTQRAKEYLLDPLNAPEPSQETGPGTHFGSTFAGTAGPKRSTNLTPPGSAKLPPVASKNPFRSSMTDSKSDIRSSITTQGGTTTSYPSPPDSTANSPTYSQNPFQHPFDQPPERQSLDSPRGPHQPLAHRPRGNSLGTRYPGDQSNKPLEIICRESKRAHRSPHLNRRHIPGADTIDKLDSTVPGKAYHHEGPFDATLLARNTSFTSSPVAAVRDTNREVLRATPKENVLDAIERHRPLDGVAVIPPGHKDRLGRMYNYKEGENMMIDLGGNYKRWPGIEYHPDDLKGKGEPQFSIDRARKMAEKREKDHGLHRTDASGVDSQDIELVQHTARPKGLNDQSVGKTEAVDTAVSSSSSRGDRTGDVAIQPDSDEISPSKKTHLGGLKRRLGSLRKRLD